MSETGQAPWEPTYFAFYVGRRDPTFVADNMQLDQQLTAAHVRHVFDL